jgi:branched-chain amino acid transport system permease protein
MIMPFFVSGLGIGAIYALSGLGLVLLFRATGVLNFALGAVGAVGAFFAWQVMAWGGGVALAVLAAVALSTAVNVAYGRYLAPLLSQRDIVVRAIGTLALALLLLSVIGVLWGDLPRRLVLPTDHHFFRLGGVRVNLTRIVAFLLSGVIVAGVTALLKYTRLGLDMRALADERDLSAILGVHILRTETLAWAISGFFAGLAGLLLGDLVRLQGEFLTFLVIPAIAAAILGQMRGLALTALAGLGMGVIEAVLTPVALISPYRALAPYFIALLTVAVLSFFSHASLKER